MIEKNQKTEAELYTEKWMNDLMLDCTLCNRSCHANRLSKPSGFCGQSAVITAARAALHFWEEPCLSGTNGSGAVFFSGCNLRCCFCQNREIALGERGMEISLTRLSEIFLSLEEQGAHNINLVTPSHYIPQICIALRNAKDRGLSLPIVYNTSSYETVESLQYLDGLIDIYLPDLKYYSSTLSRQLSQTDDYFEKATAALHEMFRQVGRVEFDSKTGLMKKGMVVRHLLLPTQTKDTKKILRYLHDTYGNDIYVSIMNQYTPLSRDLQLPWLNQKITKEEYQRVLHFAEIIGIENGFYQEGDTAKESFIPLFDYEGLFPS